MDQCCRSTRPHVCPPPTSHCLPQSSVVWWETRPLLRVACDSILTQQRDVVPVVTPNAVLRTTPTTVPPTQERYPHRVLASSSPVLTEIGGLRVLASPPLGASTNAALGCYDWEWKMRSPCAPLACCWRGLLVRCSRTLHVHRRPRAIQGAQEDCGPVPLNAILPISIRPPGVGLQPRACEVGARLDAAARATPPHLHIKGDVETGIPPPLALLWCPPAVSGCHGLSIPDAAARRLAAAA